jgi:hypothetical protein
MGLKEDTMVRIDGFGAILSVVIFLALLYLAFQWGKTGNVMGGFSNLGGGMGGQNFGK